MLVGREFELDFELMECRVDRFVQRCCIALICAALLAGASMAHAQLAHATPSARPPEPHTPELARFIGLHDMGLLRQKALGWLVQCQFDRRPVTRIESSAALARSLEQARAAAMDNGDRALVLEVLERELGEDSPDWTVVEWALLAAAHGFSGDETLAGWIRQVLEFPRGEKVSDSHGVSLRAGLEALGYNGSPAAVSLLEEATTPGFWQANGPVRTPRISTDAEQSVRQLCGLAEHVRMGRNVDMSWHLNPALFPPVVKPSADDGRFHRLAPILDAGESRVDSAAESMREDILSPEIPAEIESLVVQEIESARRIALDPSDYTALLELITHEVEADTPDWPLLRFALYAAFLHGGHDDEMTVQVRRLLERPRPDLMPDVQWDALETALALAGRIGTEESVGLLAEATKLSFWETGGPVVWEMVATHGGGAIPVEVARTEAVMAIKYAPAAVAHDALTAIANDYPNASSRFDPSRRLETSAAYYTGMAMAFVERRDGPMPEPHASLSREHEP